MITGSSESSIQIAVVLLSWNDQSGTQEAVAALLPLLDQNTQLWVVDNGSDPPFRPKDGTFSYLHVVRSDKNLGFAGGNNLGIVEALKHNPSYLLLLNTDACLTESIFSALRSYVHTHPQVAIIGPVLQEGDMCYYGGRDPALYLNTRLTSKQEVDYIPGNSFPRQIGCFH
ncbi:MAG: glycosyltransferase [Saprospiraceae bacterium]|nr:glycosyltransferase [Saprospiraceae bacterium]